MIGWLARGPGPVWSLLPMIDRRRFVHSMVPLGAARVAPAARTLRGPAGGRTQRPGRRGAASAKKLGASYPASGSTGTREVHLHSDRRVENLVNFDDYGFGVRVIVDGTWGFASAARRQGGDRAGRRAGGRDRRANRAINTRPSSSRRWGPTRHLEHADEEEPVRHPDPAKVDLCSGARGGAKVPGASFVTTS